ncbi:hypothetical protein LAZ67_23000257 [Cordylochernes scorpioides]|uniref:Adult-specific rigid cuticular protein 15.7 n=1 Tax=Cordylochernes scorpioides TaxID=51811 RepID=A0ABY6LSX8_9ARAC|nr:hypothetical protein LAZ67_23000257 [Cordylochernes scorpioides]
MCYFAKSEISHKTVASDIHDCYHAYTIKYDAHHTHCWCLQLAALVVFAAVAQAVPMLGGGASANFRKQDDFGNYAFGYQIANGYGATNGRQEVGDGHGNVAGSYNLADIDGRARKVSYVADGHGFRAVVKTNEPGTAASLPAAAVMASPYKGNFAGSYGIAHGGYGLGYGGVVGAPAYAAPVVAAAPLGLGAKGLGYGYGAGYGAGYGVGYGAGYGLGYGHY